MTQEPQDPRARRRSRPLAVVLLGLAVVGASLALSVGLFAERAPARARAEQIRLLQFNICGHACNHGRDVPGALDALVAYRPEAASLNEVCRGQLDAVESGLRRRGWAMHARFLVTAPGVCDGADYGIAVLTRARVVDTDRVTYRAQSPGTLERRGLLCVRAAVAGRTSRVCTTHLVSAGGDPTGGIRHAQLAAVAATTRAYTVPVVLMGDFNLTPDDVGMTALYTSTDGGSGLLDEVGQGTGCRCGLVTHSGGAKLDYVFVSARDFAVTGETVVPSPSSDHDVLRGVVTAR